MFYEIRYGRMRGEGAWATRDLRLYGDFFRSCLVFDPPLRHPEMVALFEPTRPAHAHDTCSCPIRTAVPELTGRWIRSRPGGT